MIQHAQRLVANAITEALRRPWKVDAFDRKGNAAGMTSPFRLTANPPRKPPSLFIERFQWGVCDPDDALGVPALAWLIREHQIDAALSCGRFGWNDFDEWREFLGGTALPFRRSFNRHGNPKYRRSESATNTVATIALVIAAAARVQAIPASEYREAFPVHLVANVTGGAGFPMHTA